MRLSALLASAFLGVLLPWAAGCTGGCGEPPSKEEEDQSGRPGPGPSGGGGEATPLRSSHFDSRAGSGKTRIAGDQARAAAAEAGPFEEVGPEDYSQKVLKSAATAFVLIYTPNCANCPVVSPILKELAPEFKGPIEFYQLNGLGPENAKLLPEGMAVVPVPGFLLYHGGRPTSRLQGIPFWRKKPPEGGSPEPMAEFQGRLKDWFRKALTQRDLEIPRP